MFTRKTDGLPRRHIVTLAVTAAVLWVAILLVSAFWNMRSQHESVIALARTEALSHLNKDRAFRLWATSQGGVYALKGPNRMVSPVLAHMPDRDLVDQFDRELTLVNPATVIREVGERFSDLYGVKTRITGRVYLNPINKPDEWELATLGRLEQGEKQVEAISTIDGKPYMRLMRPMWMEADCMRCHAITGIKVGELRGATGVAIPLQPYFDTLTGTQQNIAFSHTALAFLGLGLIGFSARRSLKMEDVRAVAEQELRRFSLAVEQSASPTMICDPQGHIVYANIRFYDVTGYAPKEVIGQTPRLLKSGETPEAVYTEMWQSLLAGKEWRGEFKNRKKNGDLFWCMETIACVKDDHGATHNYVAVIEDISERKFAEETIRHLAYYDALTDLPNRRYFQERLDQTLAWSRRSAARMVLMLMDLDRFKTINDSLGHLAGDSLLKQTAQRLTERLREGDTVARLGGDEFAMIVTSINDEQDASFVAQKLIEAMRAPMNVLEHQLRVSVSIGIAMFPSDSEQSEDLIRYADIALYQAKENGRDGYHFFSASANQSVHDRLLLENDLRHAVERNEIFLEYQPKVMLSNGCVMGVEALVRWNHPTRGRVPPNDFIPLAEDTGAILAIGDWVLREGCRQLRQWDATDLPPLHMAINVSAHQLRKPEFPRQIAALIDEFELDPSRIELEVTESLAMAQGDAALSRLDQLRQLGLGIAIDDFGTGFSSLGRLKRLPVTVLKIDRSFVRGIAEDQEDRAIAKAVVTLARTMHLDVVAEGVETEEQAAILRDMDCDMAQGYLFARPLAPQALAELLQAQTA